MFTQVHTPEHLSGQQLDDYLAQGWFRMGQTIFTTNFAHVKDAVHSTIWLRILLFDYQPDSTYQKLLKRNAAFTTTIQPAVVNEEKEILYACYRASLTFAPSESLNQLLFGKGEGASIYTTYEVTVRDGDKLIACGFFDLGGESAQGIVSFYDPAYKKYSLGRYLIYSKVQHCKTLGLKYFYPGYFVPGNPYFDYKLGIASASQEFFALGSGEWKRIETFSEAYIPVQVMQSGLIQLHEILLASGLENHVLKYEFFDANLIPEMRDSGLLDFPVFLHCGNRTDEPLTVIVVFDVRDNQYHVIVCAPVWKPDRTNPDTTFYSAYFLKPVQEVYHTARAEELAGLLIKISQRDAVRN
jgi:leucyl-tRNA---protein transferase